MSQIAWKKLKDAKSVVTPRGDKTYALANNDYMFACRNDLPKGCIKDFQEHPPVQYYIVLSGKMEVFIGDESMVLEPGDTAIVPPSVCHKVVALEDTVEIEVFNDARKDVIEKWFS